MEHDYGHAGHPVQDEETLERLDLFLRNVGNAGFFEKAYAERKSSGKNTGELRVGGVRFRYRIASFAVDAFFLYFYPEQEKGRGIIFQAIGKPDFWIPRGINAWTIDEANVGRQSALDMVGRIIRLWEAGKDEFWAKMALSRDQN
jgi:hypothetical protein